ncbi:hypothetical protein BDQ17DRAFT_1038604 [Cyathus striatus]|nr:hypothetical protein BDQ17DRAFT_1038604 [Cyathus striatus]
MLISVNLAILLAYDAAITLLTVVPAYRSIRNGVESRIVYIVFKDGVIYYICLFVLTLANMVVVSTLSPDYFNIILIKGCSFHSYMSNTSTHQTRSPELK